MSKKTDNTIEVARVEADVARGLSAAQVDERVRAGLDNKAVDPNDKNAVKIIAGNLFTLFNTVLFSIALMLIGFIIYFKIAGRDDIVNEYFGFSKFVFLIPAIMNVTMGSIQEIHSLRVIKSLRIVTATKCRVIRDGETVRVDADDVVLDDVVAVSAGEQAAADLRVVCGEVYVDESMLTGESDHVRKTPGDLILSGSSIVVGDARCRAVEVGDNTYAAKLSRKVKSSGRHKSELMSAILKIIRVLTVALGVVFVVVVTTLAIKIARTGSDPAIWNGLELSLSDPLSWGLIALTGGSFAVGIIPSGLVLTTSVALVVSIAGLAKKQTLIQELYSLENLSRIDVICLDKTGTLTDGTMNVCDVKCYAPEDEVARYARDLMSTAGDERNATAEAIYQRFGASDGAGIAEAIPFSSAVKYSGLVYDGGARLLMGAPEYLLDADDDRLSFSSERAAEGRRVIALTLDGELQAFFVIEDHIRDTAPDTLAFFRENGVTVKVISGDNPLTVSKIAQNCGIENADKYVSLAGVPLEDIPEMAQKYTVFARVSPEQKEALVAALQDAGHKVAMTGDGVNDILALRRSDSSITFAKATDAAKSCSDVVLLDNDFSHLKEVVGEGRRVVGNIRKTAVLYLMKSVAVIIFAFALIPFAKGQMWYSIENTYMLEAAVIGTGGFLLSLEPRRTPVRGSFIRSITFQSIAAGMLAAVAILTPILLNTVPKAMGAAPFISDVNIRPMMTIMLTIAGFVVVFAMCIPINRYRALTLGALVAVAGTLGMMLPSSFIGGMTMGEGMLAFDSAAGETILDSQLVREMFRPQNSEVERNLIADSNNFLVLRLFVYIAVPVFILVMFALENYVRKDYGKDVKKNRAFRIGRRMMLAFGLVIFMRAVISFIELFYGSHYSVDLAALYGAPAGLTIAVNTVYAVACAVIGSFGYKLWKDPTRRNIKIAFVMGAALLALSVGGMIASHEIISAGDALAATDGALILTATVGYIVGAVIVRANYRLGLLKPRDK